MVPGHLETERLILRRWSEMDRPLFAALNSDPVVMEHFPALLPAAESDDFVDRIEAQFERHGWGLWAVATRAPDQFIGYVGLWPATFTSTFTPAVEVGWRLGREHWGHGFAVEAARSAMTDGFDRLDLDEIVSFTTKGNERSQRVMQKLGMRRNPADDFDHPAIAEGSPLRRHVLYRQARSAWGRS